MEQMYTIDWPRLWQLNRQWRQWMEANSEFVTPADVLDTLRYMRIECNEAADVEMRNRLSKHPRNNGRDNTVYEELADALMLALTALPNLDLWFNSFWGEGMDELCDMANQAVVLFSSESPEWTLWTIDMCVAISSYPGMAVDVELRKCWHRLAWKHASKSMDNYPEELKIWQ